MNQKEQNFILDFFLRVKKKEALCMSSCRKRKYWGDEEDLCSVIEAVTIELSPSN